jgi:hypothetical protein
MEFRTAKSRTASMNEFLSGFDPLRMPVAYATISPLSSPNNHILSGDVAPVARAPRKPIKSRSLSTPVENRN